MSAPTGSVVQSVRVDISRRTPRRWLVLVAIAVAAIALAHAMDPFAWAHWRDSKVNDRDWGRLLRSMGYLPTWIILAIALWRHDSHTNWSPRGTYVLLSPLIGGLLAETLKMLIRRLRPDPDTFAYVFRAYTESPFSTRGLGIPSSHVLVAFAGAAALAHLFPRTRWLWYLLAAGCAATRLLALAHFFSDVVTAAILGWFVAVLLAPRILREGAERKTPEA